MSFLGVSVILKRFGSTRSASKKHAFSMRGFKKMPSQNVGQTHFKEQDFAEATSLAKTVVLLGPLTSLFSRLVVRFLRIPAYKGVCFFQN